MANRKKYNLLRRSVHLTNRQRAIIIGTLLGDGSLVETFSKNNLRLQIDHCAAQKEYVFWKYEALKPLVLSSPAYKSINKSWRFRTISHPDLTDVGKIFYRRRQKIVPQEITSLLEPIGLAVWFMDDGARYSNGAYVLNTQCFKRNGVRLLQKCLKEKFGIHQTSLHYDKSGWRIYIKKDSQERFRNSILPFMLPKMMYKI